jgi:hypothetical protein
VSWECPICLHPSRAQIEAATKAGEKYAAIGKRFGLTRTRVYEHALTCMKLANRIQPKYVQKADRENDIEIKREVQSAADAWAEGVNGKSWARCFNGHGTMPVVSNRSGWLILACKCKRQANATQI